MTELSKNARIAGFFYLMLMTAPLRLLYIPGTLYVTGDASATAGNIAAHETLFRLGILSDLFTGAMTLFLTLAFYRLFKAVDRSLAVMVVILGGVLPCAIYFCNVMNDFASLLIVKGGSFLAAFDPHQQDALAMLFFRIHGQMINAAEVFWGLWLIPLGLLTVRSNFLPKILGWWLVLNGADYILQSFTGILLPQYDDIISTYSFPIMFGELAFMLWLLIVGAKQRPLAATG
jgi:hypothetical protein